MISRITKLCAMVTSHALGIDPWPSHSPWHRAADLQTPCVASRASRGKFWETVLSWHLFTVKCGDFCYIPSTWTCFWVKTIYFQYTSRNPPKKNKSKKIATYLPGRYYGYLWMMFPPEFSALVALVQGSRDRQGSLLRVSTTRIVGIIQPGWAKFHQQIRERRKNGPITWKLYEIMASHGKYMSFCFVKLCLTLGQAMTNQLKAKKCPTGWCPPVISWFINPIN